MWEEHNNSESSSSSSSKKNYFDKKNLIYGGVGLIIVILVVVSGYFFFQYQNAQKQLASGAASESDVTKIIEKIGKLVELPKGEKPTLATVSNKFQLNNQAFFAKAENGDQVLVYSKNKTAILYRPSTNKIVNYATGVTIGQAETTPAPEVAGESTEPSQTGGEEVSPTVAPTATIVPTKAPSPSSSPSPTTPAQ